MLLINPQTGESFEVEEAHGNMLLRQGYYKRTTKPVEPKVKKPGRPRKGTKQ